jgi:hypothetical protein
VPRRRVCCRRSRRPRGIERDRVHGCRCGAIILFLARHGRVRAWGESGEATEAEYGRRFKFLSPGRSLAPAHDPAPSPPRPTRLYAPQHDLTTHLPRVDDNARVGASSPDPPPSPQTPKHTPRAPALPRPRPPAQHDPRSLDGKRVLQVQGGQVEAELVGRCVSVTYAALSSLLRGVDCPARAHGQPECLVRERVCKREWEGAAGGRGGGDEWHSRDH